MVRGPRKHLKRLFAPKSWMLGKEDGIYAPRISSGPHKKTESIPLCILLSKKLKIASTAKEVKYILDQRMVKVNNKVRTDEKFPVGVFDTITIGEDKDHLRVMYNTEAKFVLKRITREQSLFKLAKVRGTDVRKGNVPFVYTNDGGCFRFCDQAIRAGDTVRIDFEQNRIVKSMKLDVGSVVYLINGKNRGSVGTVLEIEKNDLADNIIKMRDFNGRIFSTIEKFLIAIGTENNLEVDLLENKGVKKSILEISNEKYGNMIVAEETA